MDKVVADAEEAVSGITDGMSLSVGGFGLCGVPTALIEGVLAGGATDLQVISNNCGVDGAGLGLLLAQRRISRVSASYVGENQEFARQYLSGELEVELTPQGTLAEKLRAAGAGIPAFYTRSGVGTQVADGGIPLRYGDNGTIVKASPPKPTAQFTMRGVQAEYVLERSSPTDFGLVRAWKGDRHGNLVFRLSARNFNPLCAMAAAVGVAEVEHLVEPGELAPDEIHLPGIYIDRVLELTPAQAADKGIEKRTTRPDHRQEA